MNQKLQTEQTTFSSVMMSEDHGHLRQQFSRRDYYLIPLVSLATIFLMLLGAEIGSRMAWPEKLYDECRVKGAEDPRRAKANCEVSTKAPEGPWISYITNACGWRTFATCGPKPSNTLRIATLGASMTMGKNVAINEIWPERLGAAIAASSGKKVEVENLGWELLTPLHCYRQIPRVIALEPELVVYAINPFDLSRGIDPNQLAHRDDPDATYPKLAIDLEDKSFSVQKVLKDFQNAFNGSRAFVMAQHFVFYNPSTFLKIYLADGHRADYLRQPFTPLWQERLHDFNTIVVDMAARLRKAGIPLVVVALPARSQVALLLEHDKPVGTDAYAFEREIETTCRNAHVTFIPTLSAFAKTPNGDKLFYIFDTHINGDGNGIISQEIANRVLHGSTPVLLSEVSSSSAFDKTFTK